MKYGYILLCCLLLPWQAAGSENSERVYQQSLNLAVQGKLSEAIVALQAASAMLPQENIWRKRMLAASILLRMRDKQTVILPVSKQNNYLQLASVYVQTHPQSETMRIWPVALLASILPGAGHAWQGRWRDAGVAALFVLPLLILTLWAARRKMGPVTVFFALLTLWLWSGTIFSAISLAERGHVELYMQWWQHVWQASALPRQPW